MHSVEQLALPPVRGTGNGTRSHPAIEGFFVGPEHQMIRVVAQSILRQQPLPYNPVVLFGGPGTGKTHLAAGLAAVWRQHPGAGPAIYVEAKSFCRQLGEVVRMKTTEDFCRRYRGARLLCMDDVDRLAGRAEAQRQLSAAIDAIGACGGQVVLTARQPPWQIPGLSPQLRSRMLAGLVVELPKLSSHTREAVLRHLARRAGLQPEPEALRLLASTDDQPLCSLAETIAELKQLAAGREVLSVALVRQYQQRHTARKPTLEQVARTTARRFQVPLAALRGPSRSRTVVTARQIASWLAWKITGSSFRRLGKYFGGRDHTTISHACARAEALVAADPALKQLVEQIQLDLQQAMDPVEKRSPCRHNNVEGHQRTNGGIRRPPPQRSNAQRPTVNQPNTD